MYYITKKDSETGKKFQKITEKASIAFEEQKAFADKYNFSQWRKAYWVAFGGISSCCNFKTTPDSKLWGKGEAENEFFPKKNSNAGKAIFTELSALTKVSVKELNACIGFKESMFKQIGFAQNNTEYFGFSIKEEWKIEVPKDCDEVLTSEYRVLFKDNGLV